MRYYDRLLRRPLALLRASAHRNDSKLSSRAPACRGAAIPLVIARSVKCDEAILGIAAAAYAASQRLRRIASIVLLSRKDS